MQPHAIGRGVGLTGQIRRAVGVAGKISPSVVERQVVTVNGKTVKVFAVDRISDVLKRGEFGFHENLIVAVVLMAHEAAVQLDVRQIQAIPLKAFYRQPAVQRARQHLAYMCSFEEDAAFRHLADREHGVGPGAVPEWTTSMSVVGVTPY